VEGNASDSPVKLGIASLCSGKHNIEYKERKQDTEHSDELKYRSGSNVAVLFFLNSLNKSGKHNTKAKEVADVSKVHVEIPSKHLDVIKNS
jgi:hypothetical protein